MVLGSSRPNLCSNARRISALQPDSLVDATCVQQSHREIVPAPQRVFGIAAESIFAHPNNLLQDPDRLGQPPGFPVAIRRGWCDRPAYGGGPDRGRLRLA